MEFKFVEADSIKQFSDKEWHAFHKEQGYQYDRKKYCLAAFVDEELAGYARFNITGGVGYLKDLLVSKIHRGKKIGSKLMNMYIQHCKEKGCHKLALRTSPKVMKDAYLLYQKKGFVVEAELKNDEFHFDDVMMSKKI